MRRAAALFAALAVTGCGDGDKDERAAPVREAGKRDAATERALERVRESDLPPDAKRELEEAAELLDDSR